MSSEEGLILIYSMSKEDGIFPREARTLIWAFIFLVSILGLRSSAVGFRLSDRQDVEDVVSD